MRIAKTRNKGKPVGKINRKSAGDIWRLPLF